MAPGMVRNHSGLSFHVQAVDARVAYQEHAPGLSRNNGVFVISVELTGELALHTSRKREDFDVSSEKKPLPRPWNDPNLVCMWSVGFQEQSAREAIQHLQPWLGASPLTECQPNLGRRPNRSQQ